MASSHLLLSKRTHNINLYKGAITASSAVKIVVYRAGRKLVAGQRARDKQIYKRCCFSIKHFPTKRLKCKIEGRCSTLSLP